MRTRLQLAGRVRDPALFNPAVDSKLRGCDVVSLKVEDVAPHGYAINRAAVRQRKTGRPVKAAVRQRKTGRPVKFEITEQTRQTIDDDLKGTRKAAGDFLFTGRRGPDLCLTTRQYARLLSEWTCGCAEASLVLSH
jgi:integrase